jgi:hypothetical protein
VDDALISMCRSGPGDAPQVPLTLAVALVLTSLCGECLAARTQLPHDELTGYLARITATRLVRGRQGIRSVMAYCERCETHKPVVGLK